jgi:NAD(P)-dependent dehydrogenase (short-subunit alcohol dehydrogenase family)
MMRLMEKVVVITGGTSGIGARTAELFVANGAKVVVAGRREREGKALVVKLGSAAAFVRTDVAVEADVKAMISFAVTKFGRLDCLFNNAGGPSHAAGIAAFDVEKFDAGIAVHVRGALLGMKYAAVEMVRQRSGSIINMGSINGLRAGFAALGYSTAKAAVIHLTRCVAIELGECGVRVNSISPGPVITGIFGKAGGLPDEAADSNADGIRGAFAVILPQLQAIPRVGITEDIAQAALFLASDDSTFVNGHDLVVDGGITAGRPMSVMRKERELFARALTRDPVIVVSG